MDRILAVDITKTNGEKVVFDCSVRTANTLTILTMLKGGEVLDLYDEGTVLVSEIAEINVKVMPPS